MIDIYFAFRLTNTQLSVLTQPNSGVGLLLTYITNSEICSKLGGGGALLEGGTILASVYFLNINQVQI